MELSLKSARKGLEEALLGHFARASPVWRLLSSPEVSSLGVLRVLRLYPAPFMLLRPPLEYLYEARLVSSFGADLQCLEEPLTEHKLVSLSATLREERIRVQYRAGFSLRKKALDVRLFKI